MSPAGSGATMLSIIETAWRYSRSSGILTRRQSSASSRRRRGSAWSSPSPPSVKDRSVRAKGSIVGGKCHLDAAERAEICGNARTASGEDHARPGSSGYKRAGLCTAPCIHQIREIHERRNGIAHDAAAAIRKGLVILGDGDCRAAKIIGSPIRQGRAVYETAIREIVGKDRQPVEFTERIRPEVDGVPGIDDFDRRVERNRRRHLGAFIGRGARRQIAVKAKGNLCL